MNLPFIDVVVPTFNRAPMLERMIAALVNQSYPPERYQVIVVDDGSTDDTWSVLQETAGRHSRVRALRIAHAGSYAARNYGWRRGVGDIVAFTDDDCVADRDWIASIARSFDSHPEALGVQGKTITLPRLVGPLTHQIVVNGPNTIYHTCNIAYKRKVLTLVGGFDEAVVHYSGDSQLGAAVSHFGPIIFSSEMIIVHPPRPRLFLGRTEWNRRLEESLRLCCRYPEFYRRNRGPHFLFVVAARWAVGSTIKQVVVNIPWIIRDPILYLRFLARLAKERIILLAALPHFWREHRAWIKDSKGTSQSNLSYSAEVAKENVNPPFIDVVVPTFNRASMLDRIVASLMAQSYPAARYLVTVVNDGSTDETRAVLQRMAGRWSQLRPLHVPHAGLSAARNCGWRNGRGEIVAFTDDDCIADSGWLAAVARAFANNPEAMAVYGETTTVPELVTPFTHQIVVTGPNTFYHGCNIAYQKRALLAAGGFDERAHYSEDSQLAAAVLAHGPIVFSREMAVIHPPRPRVFADRRRWTEQLEGVLRLYCRYPDFFRRARGSHFLLVVVIRWLLVIPIKNAVKNSPWLFRNPFLYLKFLACLARERALLLLMLPNFWRTHRDWVKNLKGANPAQPVNSGGASK